MKATALAHHTSSSCVTAARLPPVPPKRLRGQLRVERQRHGFEPALHVLAKQRGVRGVGQRRDVDVSRLHAVAHVAVQHRHEPGDGGRVVPPQRVKLPQAALQRARLGRVRLRRHKRVAIAAAGRQPLALHQHAAAGVPPQHVVSKADGQHGAVRRCSHRQACHALHERSHQVGWQVRGAQKDVQQLEELAAVPRVEDARLQQACARVSLRPRARGRHALAHAPYSRV